MSDTQTKLLIDDDGLSKHSDIAIAVALMVFVRCFASAKEMVGAIFLISQARKITNLASLFNFRNNRHLDVVSL